MIEARYYEKLNNGNVKCHLCPRECEVENIKSGLCLARGNIDGKLYSANYGIISSLNLDVIEKNNLRNFHSREKILSIGSFGCSLKCKFCQTWETSQTGVEENLDAMNYSPEKITEMAVKMNLYGNIGVAYTYNEPLIGFEFVMDTAKLIRAKGLKNVLVSNGYINIEPLEEIIPHIDAFSIDLKAFSDKTYKEITNSSIEEVKRSLKIIKNSGKHLEITYLVIAGVNDSTVEFQDMVNWIEKELGKETVLHIKRCISSYQMKIENVSNEMLEKLSCIAKEKLEDVYIEAD